LTAERCCVERWFEVIKAVSHYPAVSIDVMWGVTMAFVAMAIYGACMVTVAVSAKNMSSGPGSFLAATAGVPIGIIIVLTQWVGGQELSVPTAGSVAAFALAGICSTYLGRWLVFKSIELMGPSGSAGLQSISPLITAVFGWIFLGEVIGSIGMAGIALGIAGLVAMSMGISRSQRKSDLQALALGLGSRHGFVYSTLLVGVGSAAAYSLSHLFRAFGVRQWNEALMGALIGAVAGLFVLAAANHKKIPEYVRQARVNPRATCIYLSVGGFQFIAQSLVIASMKYIPASMAALISMCTPLVVLPISYFALRNAELLSWVTVLGIAITLTGIMLVILYGGAAPAF
jgi:drug/metabolite transporter (DMT)-like permease